MKQFWKQVIAVTSSAMMAAQPMFAQGITVAPVADDLNTYDAANGVPIVDIEDSNSNGVSHNLYKEFNVGTEGVILNNSNQNFANTNLAGVITGNANLQNGPASVIINEVIYNNPSELLGYVEVAGGQADVIIANPYGITCNGCGFINTDHATLTTGSPGYEGGQFTNIDVTRGAVAIGELGVDATGVSTFDILSRTVQIDGAIHGQQVNIVAGQNNVIYATGAVSKNEGDGSAAPSIAIDSNVLGGMYADSIVIISTEKGSGVKAPPKMAANAGEMVITADGQLVMAEAYAQKEVKVKAETVTVTKYVKSEERINIEAARDAIIEANGQLVAQSGLEITTGGDLQVGDNAQLVTNSGALSAIAGGNIELGENAIVSNATGNVQISSGDTITMNVGAAFLANRDLDIDAVNLTTNGSNTIAAGAANAEGDVETADLNVELSGDADLADSIVSASNDVIFAADAITISGSEIDASRFVGGNNLTITAQSIDATNSGLGAANDTSVQTSSLTGENYTVSAGSNLDITDNGTGITIEGANLEATQNVTVVAQSIDSDANVTAVSGDLTLTSTTGDLSNSGALYGGTALALASGGTLNNSGALTGGSSIDLAASGDLSNDGTFLSGGAVAMISGGALENNGFGYNTANGITSSNGDASADATSLTLTGTSLSNAGDMLIAGATTFTTNAGDLSNAGDVTSYGALTIDASRDVNVSGDLTSYATLDITGRSADISGDLFANSNASIDVSNALDLSGSLSTNASIDITAASAEIANLAASDAIVVATTSGDLDFTGLVQANNVIGITSAGAIDLSNSAEIHSATSSIDMTANGAIAQAGTIWAAIDVNLTSNGFDHSGTTTAKNAITIDAGAGDISNSGTLNATQLVMNTSGSLDQSGTISTHILSLDLGQNFTNSGTITSNIFGQIGDAGIENNTIGGNFTNAAGGTINSNYHMLADIGGNLNNAGEILSAGVDGNASIGNIFLSVDGSATNSGRIDAAQTISLASLDLNNQSGGKIEGNYVDITTTQDITNAGSIISTGGLNLTTATALANSGTVQAFGNNTITAPALTNTGTITATAGITSITAANSFDNESGTIYGDAGLILETNGGLDFASLGSFSTLGAMQIGGIDDGSIAFFNIGANEEFGNIGDLSISADEITNAGAIYSADGNLTLSSAGDINNTGVLYAGGDWLRLYADGTIDNNGGAILANNNMLIAGIDFDGSNGDRAASLINQHEGLIETFNGDMFIYADEIENTHGGDVVYTDLDPIVTNDQIGSGSSGSFGNDSYNYDKVKTTTTGTTVKITGKPSSIISGGNINVVGQSFANEFSLVSATGGIDFDVSSVENIGAESTETEVVEVEHWRFVDARWPKSNYHTLLGIEDPEITHVVTDEIFGTIEAGGSITGYVGDFTNGVAENVSNFAPSGRDAPTAGNISAPSILASLSANAAGLTGFGSVDGIGSKGLLNFGDVEIASVGDLYAFTSLDLSAIDNENLFTINTSAPNGYLIETRYEFINQESFASSEYFLDRIGFDPSANQLRLGDAFAETHYIRDQIIDATGGRILMPGLSEADQIRAMYDNAVDQADALGLRPGIALTSAQQAALTQDIIWYETQIIGGRSVLVPTVYLVDGGTQYASLGGAQITAGGGINLDVGTLTNNGGTISAGSQLIINADNDIINNGGNLFGGMDGAFTNAAGVTFNVPSVMLTAGGTVANYSGVISGESVMIDAADIIIETQSQRFGDDSNFTDIAMQTAQVNATGDLTMIAGNDINITGADISAEGSGFITAEGNVNFNALVLESSYSHSSSSSGWFGSGSSSSFSGYSAVADTSSVTTGGDLTITSTGGNIVSMGAELTAGTSTDGGTLTLDAHENVVLAAVYDVHETSSSSSGSGWFGLSGNSNDNYSYSSTSTGSSLSGTNINVTAGNAEDGSRGSITLIGADINATDNASFSANGDIAVLAAIDQSITSDASSSHGFFQGGGNGFLSIYGGEGGSDYVATSTVNGSSIVAGGNVSFEASGSMLAEAADVTAGGNIDIDVADTVLITGVANTTTIGTTDDQWGIGLSFSSTGSSASLFAGYQGSDATFDQQSVEYTGSNFVAGGDVNITATNDVTVAGSNIAAGAVIATGEFEGTTYEFLEASETGGRINITSTEGDVNSYALENYTTTDETFSQTQIGVTASVSSGTLAGVQQLAGAVDSFGEGQGNLSGLNDASAILAATSGATGIADGINAYAEGLENGASSNQQTQNALGMGATVGIGMTTSSSSNSSSGTQLVTSSFQSFGGDTNIDAANDINLIATSVTSTNDITLTAGNDINILSGQEAYSNSSENSSFGFGITYGVDLSNGNVLPGYSAHVEGSLGQTDGSGVNQVNSSVIADGTLTISSGNDTNVIGAVVSGTDLIVDVGGDLNVASVQDTGSSSGSSSNFSVSGGAGGLGSVGVGGGDSGSDTAWVTEQTSLTGTNSATITVDGHTQLDGAIIGSETEGGLDFETGTFGSTDIADNNESHDNSLNVSVGLGDDPTGTVTGDLANSDMEQDNNATVLGGDVVITDEEAQAELADGTSPDAVDGVNYDETDVNTDIDQAQVITKDENNSATVYIDTAAIEEIVEGAPTITEALDHVVDYLESQQQISPESSAALDQLLDAANGDIDVVREALANATCTEVSATNFWNFNWVLGSAAHASFLHCAAIINGVTMLISPEAQRECYEAVRAAYWLATIGNENRNELDIDVPSAIPESANTDGVAGISRAEAEEWFFNTYLPSLQHADGSFYDEDLSIYHQMGKDSEGNMKFSIEIDGHSTEFVMDDSGNLVDNATNGGTHNFGNDFPDHFLFDMLPYYINGTGDDDPTEWLERLTSGYPYDPNFTPSERDAWEAEMHRQAAAQVAADNQAIQDEITQGMQHVCTRNCS